MNKKYGKIVIFLCIAVTVNIIYGIVFGGFFAVKTPNMNNQTQGEHISDNSDKISIEIKKNSNNGSLVQSATSTVSVILQKYKTDPEVSDTPKTENNTGSTLGRILIYHTHTNEAYMKNETEKVQKIYASRTGDSQYTVLKVGKTLEQELISVGFDTVHDTTNNEANGFNKAYATSRATVETNIEKSGEFDVYIDIHRDSYVSGVPSTVIIDNESVARIMLVVGNRAPDFEENYALACRVHDALNQIHPQLCEKVLVANATYNQNISSHSLLIEIGDNGVTVDEACNSAKYVAEALAAVMSAS